MSAVCVVGIRPPHFECLQQRQQQREWQWARWSDWSDEERERKHGHGHGHVHDLGHGHDHCHDHGHGHCHDHYNCHELSWMGGCKPLHPNTINIRRMTSLYAVLLLFTYERPAIK